MSQLEKKNMKVLILEPTLLGKSESSLAMIFADPRHYHNSDSFYTIDAVLISHNYREAMDLLDDQHPDVLLIHHDKTGDEGFEFARQVRAKDRERHTGIVFISSERQLDDTLLDNVLRSGADDLIDDRVSPREFLVRINAVFRFKETTDRLRAANHRLQMISLTDELTGLQNMRAFNWEFQKLIRTCRAGSRGLGVLMFDLDHFKSVNDQANHLVGSYVIGEVGRLILHSEVLPKDAVAARYGGDEYIIAIPAASMLLLWDVAERLRYLIQHTVFKRDRFMVKLTASFGIGWVEGGFSGKSSDLIKSADVMLYRSKNSGRNRVSGMKLVYPVDFSNIQAPHLTDREQCLEAESLPKRHLQPSVG